MWMNENKSSIDGRPYTDWYGRSMTLSEFVQASAVGHGDTVGRSRNSNSSSLLCSWLRQINVETDQIKQKFSRNHSETYPKQSNLRLFKPSNLRLFGGHPVKQYD